MMKLYRIALFQLSILIVANTSCVINCLTPNLRKTDICAFLHYFSFTHFLVTSCYFQKKKSSLNSALNFRLKKLNFCSLNVLACCCEANENSKIASIFSKIVKGSVRLNIIRVMIYKVKCSSIVTSKVQLFKLFPFIV